MEKYTFKLNNIEEEFLPIEVSKDMRDFLEAYEDTTISGETKEYKIHHIDSILEALQDSANFETGCSGASMGEYGSIHHLFIEFENFGKKTKCDFIGIKKQVTNIINTMETIFKVGMKVYDQVNFPDEEGEIIKVDNFPCPIIVEFNGEEYSYRLDGSFQLGAKPTLSTSPYKVEFQGFEQKAPVPTYEEALKEAHRKDEYYYLPNDLEAPSKELADAVVTLLKLLFLRDYYNEGWQPDFSKETKNTKYCISKDASGRFMKYDYYNYDFNNVLIFKSKQIRSKFWDEQLELMKIAKPLL